MKFKPNPLLYGTEGLRADQIAALEDKGVQVIVVDEPNE